MKKRLILLSPLVLLLPLVVFFSDCTQLNKTASSQKAIPYSPYVEAFTHGEIPRSTPIYLIFKDEVKEELQNEATLRKVMSIKPSIAGEFSFENSKTIVFRPKDKFDRNTTYSVSADMKHLVGADKEYRKFSFNFTTRPLLLRAGFEALNVSENSDNTYDVVCNIYTPDREELDVLKLLIKPSENVKVDWEQLADGRQNRVTFKDVPARKRGVSMLNVSVRSNKYGVSKGELLAIYIPGEDDFGLYDVNYVTAPERYIEATFTKKIDAEQNLEGLAYIKDNNSNTVTVDGNKIRLYPDAGGGQQTVKVHFTSQIKSSKGVVLGEEISREIEVGANFPAVRMIGTGTVIPQSTQVLLPFQAVYLRGVVVKVIKISEQNMGQFLQINNLEGNGEIVRVGRLMARKTIFIDQDDHDLTQWSTYAIDLRELIEPEQGALYRVELSFNKDLSAYPCDYEQLTKEEILASDEAKLKAESTQYDGSNSYYYYDYGDDYGYYYDYDYSERNDPCSNTFYMYNTTQVGRNVLATNLGVIAKEGKSGEMIVLVHNLITTEAERGVEIRVYNFQYREIAKAMTDDKGVARLDLGQHRAFYVVASQGQQRSYLKVYDNVALSMSAFDVSGEVVQKGLKGFIYGDRGVWRPGDTMHLGFMLGDLEGKLPADHPVVMELYNPMGQLYLKKVQNVGSLGLYAFDMATEHDSPTGAWNVKVEVGGATFTKRVRVEAIKPNRLKIDLSFGDKRLVRGDVKGKLHVEWLQGATARNLKYEIESSFYSIPTKFDGLSQYTFDDPIKRFDSEQGAFDSGTTDNVGEATIGGRIDVGNYAPGMLMASFNTRVYEESGDFSIDALQIPFSPYTQYVGINSPQKDKQQLHTGKDNRFELVSVDPDGKTVSGASIKVDVHKIYWYWWWSSNKESIANYISDNYSSRVKNFTLTTNSSGKASFNLNFSNDEWGTYYISVTDSNSGHSTGVISYFDWASISGRRDMEGSDAATRLVFTTDKNTYAPADKMVLTVPSSKGSRAVVSIENGSRVVAISEHECKAGETTIEIAVTQDMMPNAFVHVSLLQPHGITINDLPIRLYGVVPITVTSPTSYLHPVLTVPDEIKPEQKYEIVVSEKSGREMAYTLAIVDEGLLDLTRFQTPDPWRAFNGREALGVRTWDMYNHVVGAYGGRIEQMFSIGGDEELESGPKAIVSRFKPVVQFEGPFVLKKGGKQKHSYTMPNYSGRVRVMVVAGDGRAYGNADKSMMVRKPVMLLGTLPRVIGINEEMEVPATVFATKDGVGNVQVAISCSDNMQIVGANKQGLDFSQTGDKQAKFRIKVGPKSGVAKVTLTAVSAGDKSVYETDIEIRSVYRPQVKVTSATIQPNQTWKESVELVGMSGTNNLSLEISDVQPVNLAARLGFLLGYPHGCIEQITSKGFPQLYLDQFASLTKAQLELSQNAVKDVLNRYRSYQIGSGAFSYWPGGTSSHGWGSVYAAHFMVEATAKGFHVQEQMKQNLLKNLRQVAAGWKSEGGYSSQSEELTQAYRLYVLALAKVPETGAMNRLRESSKLSAMSRWTLATAYATMGRVDIAKSLLETTVDAEEYRYGQYDYTFGSNLRDDAFKLIANIAIGDAGAASAMTNKISKVLSSDDWLSTQATGFALIAMSKYMDKYSVGEQMQFTYSCDGKGEAVKSDKNIWMQQLLTKYDGTKTTLEVKNNSDATLFIRIITEGIPDQGMEQAYENGLKLNVTYVNAEGNRVDVSNLEQGTNFTAVAVLRNPTSQAYNNLILTQIFPAGWEILNTRFTDESAPDNLPAGVNYQDIRDDRVYSHIDRLGVGRQITVRINLAAVYEGLFYFPPVYTEAMYDNLIRANTEGQKVVVRK